jgi:hypothetical protein
MSWWISEWMFEITIWRSGSWCCRRHCKQTKQKHQNLRNDFATFVWWLQMSFWSPHSLVSYTTLAHGFNNGDDGTWCQQVSSLEGWFVCVCVCVCAFLLRALHMFQQMGVFHHEHWRMLVVLFSKHGCMSVQAIELSVKSPCLSAWY